MLYTCQDEQLGAVEESPVTAETAVLETADHVTALAVTAHVTVLHEHAAAAAAAAAVGSSDDEQLY
jgi:hypothetical protein